jgi:gas vesicle protein
MEPIQQEFPQSNGSSWNFVLGLACGAIAGAALGMLFAPKPGPELRQQVATSARQASRKASEVYDQATQAVNEAVVKGRKAWDAGREAFQTARPGTASQSDGAM